SAAVAGIDRCVGLNVDQRTVGIELTGNRTDDAHRDRSTKAARAAEREDDVALAYAVVVADRQGGKIRRIDLEDRKIDVVHLANDSRVQRLHPSIYRSVG